MHFCTSPSVNVNACFFFLQAGSSNIQLLEREVAILKKVHHPNIIQLIEVMETATVSRLSRSKYSYNKYTKPMQTAMVSK